MITGKSPIIIFSFIRQQDPNEIFGIKLPDVRTSITAKSFTPIPIPIVLENTDDLTNFQPRLSVSNRTEKVADNVFQRTMGTQISKKIQVKRDSTIAGILIPLFTKCMEYALGDGYFISYFENEFIIFDGKISTLEIGPDSDDNDLINIEFSISDTGKTDSKSETSTSPNAFGTPGDIQ